MPKLTIDKVEVQVPAGKRLINALIDEGHTDQLHACGGNARCTTCRVQFISGEPNKMTQAERDLLAARALNTQKGLRLSCQINCDADMEISVISRLAGSGRKDAGGRPDDAIQPPPVWVERS
jgi:ferredoxin